MAIAISGASGALGRTTAEFLMRSVPPSGIVLLTRKPDRLADFAARGVRVRHADFNESDTLAAAFDGVERLLLISTDAVGDRLRQHRAAVTAAATAGVGHVVYTSVPEPISANPAIVVADHAGTEQALRDSGMTWTSLRNNVYAHLQIGAVHQAARTGRLITNVGTGAAAYVSREDCAAAAAAVLRDGGHENVACDVTGPQAITASDIAALAGQVGRREVEIHQVDDDVFAEGLRSAGLPELAVRLVTSFGASTRGGFLATVSSTVRDLTGREPRPFADVIRETALT